MPQPEHSRACVTASAKESTGKSPPAVDTPACPAKLTLARLLVHATEGVGDGRSALPLFLSRLRAWATAAKSGRPAAPVGLRIADLQGRQYFTANELPSVIDLPLPAGTYHVTVSHGGQHRRYTVALEQGITFDLHLRGAAQHR